MYQEGAPFLVMADEALAPWWIKALRELAACNGMDSIECQVKVGLELALHEQVSAVTVPPGRSASSVERYARSTPFTPWAKQLERLEAAIHEPLVRQIPRGPVVRRRGDLVVFSRLPTNVIADYSARLRRLAGVWLAGHVDLSDPVVWRVAWQRLLFLGALVNGVWMKSLSEGDIEDPELTQALSSGLLPNQRTQANDLGFRNEGFILDAFEGILLAPEQRFWDLGIPCPPRAPDWKRSPLRVTRTAQQKALDSIVAKGANRKSHRMDDVSKPGLHVLSSVADQVPDVD